MESTASSARDRLIRARRQWLQLDPYDGNVRQKLTEIRDIFQDIFNDKAIDSETRTNAGERLALLLIQMGEESAVATADSILSELQFTCRLSRHILGYQTSAANDDQNPKRASSSMVPCAAYDNFLSQAQLEGMQRIFLDPEAPYWAMHNYQVEPPSPYYSYVLPISHPNLSKDTLLGSVIHKLLNQMAIFKPAAAKQAQFIELWAHNRPIATGHQLHLDSDNEGAESVIRHPLLTAILYLTGHGGPTCITNQRLVSQQAADKAWLLYAQCNRAALMDGRVLHCVVPGNVEKNTADDDMEATTTTSACRRVSVMIAFWKSIRIREEPTAGAARPFPDTPWAKALFGKCCGSDYQGGVDVSISDPVPPAVLTHVYERVPDGQPWTRLDGLPDYEQVFQGM
jgi:hypothetical protein